MALYTCLFSSWELSDDRTISTARLNSFGQIITASKSDFCVKQSTVSRKTKQRLNECLCPDHRISNNVFTRKKNEVTKAFDNETSKIFLLRCGELEATVKKKKGWSTLSPKLFLELLLPGLQKTQLKPIYSYDPSWGEDGGKRAVRCGSETERTNTVNRVVRQIKRSPSRAGPSDRVYTDC